MRVIIIDDDKVASQALSRYLQAQGFQVEYYPDGVAGLERALRHPPECIVLDLMMPRLDGFGTLQVLAEHRLTARVLVLTSQAHTAQTFVQRYGVPLLSKPTSLRRILRHVIQRVDPQRSQAFTVGQVSAALGLDERELRTTLYTGGWDIDVTAHNQAEPLPALVVERLAQSHPPLRTLLEAAR